MTEGTYLNEVAKDSVTSRRKFLAGSAAALAGGALMAVPGAAFAKGDDDDDGKKPGGVSDVDILNYALVLERLEYEFYKRYLNRFSERQIEGAAIFDGFGNKVRSKIY
ncbi:MAG TPA: ferritin-like domain-containing protein, partial [Rubrobacter sp.]